MKRIHGNSRLYWKYQERFAKETLIPLLRKWQIEPTGKRVLEIGCGEGGILHALADEGAMCTGIELNPLRIENGKKYAKHDISMIVGDFCTDEIREKIGGSWDLILLRDVLEHLLDKETAMKNIVKIINPNGSVFFDFCPWYMPFGGHQQALSSFLRFIPFLHWLPRNIYERIIYWSDGKNQQLFKGIMDTYESRITLSQYGKLLSRYNLTEEKRELFLLNPSYKIRFGLPEVKLGVFSKLPILPEIFATNIYSLVKPLKRIKNV